MTKYYTVEKAKFGGTTGTVIPFTIQLPSTNFPNFGDWDTYVPAGYLRCDGSILRAELYPQLASVIGTGTNCPFAKQPDLGAEFFQLPDLGSKYIRCSTSSGQYLNNTLEQDANTAKVGTETLVETLIGDEVVITYSGSFQLETDTTDFFGNPFFRSSDNDENTFEDTLTEENWQAHGHNADVGVFTYLGNWTDSFAVDTGEQVDNEGKTEGANTLLFVEQPDSALTTVKHDHQIIFPSSTTLRDNTNFQFTYGSTQISPDGLETTISLSVEDVKKLDTAVSPYILVEYIIKI